VVCFVFRYLITFRIISEIDPSFQYVGQYQHDVDQNKLKEELTQQLFVASIGGNYQHSESKYLLSYVSGIEEKLAENIVQYRS
jgi:uncharacterized protein